MSQPAIFMKPPPLPEETLRRVLRVANFNGKSVVILAALGAVISLLMGDFVGTAVGALVAYGGWVELAGRKQVSGGDAEGMKKMISAQWLVLGPVLVYCVTRLVSFDSETALGMIPSDMRTELLSAGVDLNAIMSLVKLTFYLTYSIFAFVTLLYQGGMARYYRRRIPIVQQALADRLKPKLSTETPRSGPAPEDLVT